jgi:hypothetical protein
MVTEHGGIKIMDFGIARVSGAEHLTSDGHMMGTPAYMAPEQVLAKDVDSRADVYSCGVVFYRLLTGKLPFEADTAIGMVQKQLSDTPTPAHEHRADLPAWCQTVLDRALAKSPADRYQTGGEFRAALLSAMGNATEHTSVLAAAHIAGSTPPQGGFVSDAAAPPRPALAPPTRPAAAATAPAARAATSLDGATIVLQKNHFAVAGGLLAVGAVGVAVLAFVAIRGTASVPASAVPSSSAAVSTPPAVAPTPTPPPVAATNNAPAEPAAAGKVDPPVPQATVPPVLTASTGSTAKPSRNAPAPAPAPSKATSAAFVFDAKAVVADGGKNREHEVFVQMDDGTVTVKERNQALVTSVPYRSLLAVTYSSSKQPLWQSPSGPAQAVKVDGGALRFLKGSRNWLVLRTSASTLVLRVDDDDLRRVMSAIEARTGIKVERVAERKD